MKKTELIRFISIKNKQGVNPAPPTIAKALNVQPDTVNLTKDQINADKIYQISSKQGGGLLISASGPSDESSTYQYITPHITDWVKKSIYGKHGLTFQILEETHRKKLSGKWSTPDFSMIIGHKFSHLSISNIEIVTIEVKHASKQFDVSCVYEAYSHTRMANYSVLFFYVDPNNNIEDQNLDSILDEIKMECVRLGIGLVLSEYPIDIDTWQVVIPARKHDPDLRRMDAFIEEAYTNEQQKQLKQRL